MLVNHAFNSVVIIILLAGAVLSHRDADHDASADVATLARRPAHRGHVERRFAPSGHRRHRRKREVSHPSGEKFPGLDNVKPVAPEPHHFELATDVPKKHKKLKKVASKAQIRDRIKEVNTMLFGEQAASEVAAKEAQPSELLSRSTSKEHCKGKPAGKNSSKSAKTAGKGKTTTKYKSTSHPTTPTCSATSEEFSKNSATCDEMESTAESVSNNYNNKELMEDVTASSKCAGDSTTMKTEGDTHSDKLFGIYDEQSMRFVPLQMGRLSSKRDEIMPSPLDANVQESAYQLEQLKRLYSGKDLEVSAEKDNHEECQKETAHKDVVHLARVQSDPRSRQLHQSAAKMHDAVVDKAPRPAQKQIHDGGMVVGEMCHLAQIKPSHKHDQRGFGQNQRLVGSTDHRDDHSNVRQDSRSVPVLVQPSLLILKRSSDVTGVTQHSAEPREAVVMSPSDQCELLKAVQNVAHKAVLVLSNPALQSGAMYAGAVEPSAPAAASSEHQEQNGGPPKSYGADSSAGENKGGMAENDVPCQTGQQGNKAGVAQNDLSSTGPGQVTNEEVNKPGFSQNDLAFSAQTNSAAENSALNMPGMSQNDLCAKNHQHNSKEAMAEIDSAWAGPSQLNGAASDSVMNKPGMAQNGICAQPPLQSSQTGMAQSDSQVQGISLDDLCHQNPGNKPGTALNDFAMVGSGSVNSLGANSAMNKPGMSLNDLGLSGSSQVNSAIGSSAVNKPGMAQSDTCFPSSQPKNNAGMAQNDLGLAGLDHINSGFSNSAVNKPGMSQDDLCKPSSQSANKAGIAQHDLAMIGNSQGNSALDHFGLNKPGTSQDDLCNHKDNKAGLGMQDLGFLAPTHASGNSAVNKQGMAQIDLELSGPSKINSAMSNSALNKPEIAQNDLCAQNPQKNKPAMAQIDSVFAGPSHLSSAMSNSALNKPGIAQNDLCAQNPQKNKPAMAQIDSAFAGPSQLSNAMSNSALNKQGIAQNDLCAQNPQKNKPAMAQIDSAFTGPSQLSNAMSNSALNKQGIAQNDLCAQNPQKNKPAMAQIDSAFAGPNQLSSAMSNSALNKPGIAQNDLCTQNPQKNKPGIAQNDLCTQTSQQNRPGIAQNDLCTQNPQKNKPGISQNDLCTQNPPQNKPGIAQNDLCIQTSQQNKPGIAQNDLCTQNPQKNKPGIAQNDLCAQNPQKNKPAMAQIDSAFAGPSQLSSAMSNSALNKPGIAQNDLCIQNPPQNKPGIAQNDLCTQTSQQNKPGIAQNDLCTQTSEQNKPGIAQNDLCTQTSQQNKPGIAQNDLCTQTSQQNKPAMAQNDSAFEGPSQLNSATSNLGLNKPGMSQNDLCTQNSTQGNKAGMAQKELALPRLNLATGNKPGTAQNDLCAQNSPQGNKAGMAKNDFALSSSPSQLNNAVGNSAINKPGVSRDDLCLPNQQAGVAQNDLSTSTTCFTSTTEQRDVLDINKEFQEFNNVNRAGVNANEITNRQSTECGTPPKSASTLAPANKAGFGGKDVDLHNQTNSATTTPQTIEDVKYEWPTGDCNKTSATTLSTSSASTTSASGPVKNAQAANSADVAAPNLNKQTSPPKLSANASQANTPSASHCGNSFQTLFNATGAAVDEKHVYPEVTNRTVASANDLAIMDREQASRSFQTTPCTATSGYVFPEQAGTLILPCEDKTQTTPTPSTVTTARPVRSGERRLVLTKRHLSAEQMRKHLAAVSFMKGFNGNALFPPGWVPTGSEAVAGNPLAGSPLAGDSLPGNLNEAAAQGVYPEAVNDVPILQNNVGAGEGLAANSQASANIKSEVKLNNGGNSQEVSNAKGAVDINDGAYPQREPSGFNNVAVNRQGGANTNINTNTNTNANVYTNTNTNANVNANAKAVPSNMASDSNGAELYNFRPYSYDQLGLDDAVYVKPLPDAKQVGPGAYPTALNTEKFAVGDLQQVEFQGSSGADRVASIAEPARPASSKLLGNAKSAMKGRTRPNALSTSSLLSAPVQDAVHLAPLTAAKQEASPAAKVAQGDSNGLTFSSAAFTPYSDAKSDAFHQLQADYNAVPSLDVASAPEKFPAGEVSELKLTEAAPLPNSFAVKEVEKPLEPYGLNLADPFQIPIVKVDEEASGNPNTAHKYDTSLKDIYLPSVNSKTYLDNVLGQPRPQEQELIQHLLATAYGKRQVLPDGAGTERHARSPSDGISDEFYEYERPRRDIDYDDVEEFGDFERPRRDVDDVYDWRRQYQDDVDAYDRQRRDQDHFVDELDDYEDEQNDPRRALEFLRHQAMVYEPRKRQWHHLRDPYLERKYEGLGQEREASYRDMDEEEDSRPQRRPKPRCHEEPAPEEERPTAPPPRMYVPPVDASNHNFELPERMVKVRKRSVSLQQNPFWERGQSDSSASEGFDRSKEDNRVEREECSSTASVEEDDVEPDEEEPTDEKEVKMVPENEEEDLDDEFEQDLELVSPDRDEDVEDADETQDGDFEEGGKNDTVKTARWARRVQRDPTRPCADKVVVMVSLPADRDYDSVWQRTAPPPPPLRTGTPDTVDPFEECFETFGKTTDLAKTVSMHKPDVGVTVSENSTQQASMDSMNTITTHSLHDASSEAITSTISITTSEKPVSLTSTEHSSKDYVTNMTLATNATYITSTQKTPTTTLCDFDIDIAKEASNAAQELSHPALTTQSYENSTLSNENSTQVHSTTNLTSSTTIEQHGPESTSSSKEQKSTEYTHPTIPMLKISTCHSSTHSNSTSKLVTEDIANKSPLSTTKAGMVSTHKTSCSTRIHFAHTTHPSKPTTQHPPLTSHAGSSTHSSAPTIISKKISTVSKIPIIPQATTCAKESRLHLHETSEEATQTTHALPLTSLLEHTTVHDNFSHPVTPHDAAKFESKPNCTHTDSTHVASKTSPSSYTTTVDTTISGHTSHQSLHSQWSEVSYQPTASSLTTKPTQLDEPDLESDQELSDDFALEVISDQQTGNKTTFLPHTTLQGEQDNHAVASGSTQTNACEHPTADKCDMNLLTKLEKLCHEAREEEARRHDKHDTHSGEKTHMCVDTEKQKKSTSAKHSAMLKKPVKGSKIDEAKHMSSLESLRKRFRPVSHDSISEKRARAKAMQKDVAKRRGKDHSGSQEIDLLSDWNDDSENDDSQSDSFLGSLKSRLGMQPKKEATQKRSDADDIREVSYDEDDDLDATKTVADSEGHLSSLWSPPSIQPKKETAHKRNDGDGMFSRRKDKE